MHFRYQKWDDELARKAVNLEELKRLFMELLLRTAGQVEEAFEWMEQLWERYKLDSLMEFDEFKAWLEEQRLVARDQATGQSRLTRLGERTIRRDSLLQIFGNLKKSALGNHPTPKSGQLGERLAETRPYQFGDSVGDIDFTASIRNAYRRPQGGSLSLHHEDLEVFETEHLSSCATVLLLDISHSMTLYGEDRITPAKKVALALVELIRTQFPKDSLEVAVFGNSAEQVQLSALPYMTNGPFHTNTRAGLQLAQRMLSRKKHPNKQIFMITDGKPSCMDIGGEHYRNSIGLDPAIVAKTLDEANSCRRKKIVISTFMVTQDPELVQFIEQLTQTNKGRAYYSDPESVGNYILVDFLKNRRRRV